MDSLERFVNAQEGTYQRAIAEVTAGEKVSHWMWFIFPQLRGLGQSPTARQFGIADRAEAEAYLRHPVLGPRLEQIAAAAVAVPGRTANEIFGWPDDVKLRSCATLFAVVAPGTVFTRVLERFFDGEPDRRTVELLGNAPRAAYPNRTE